jgi:hypothetical protein
MVGSCATRNREPGQARKGAAVSGDPGVPQGRPAGAGCRGSAGFAAVENDGVAISFSFLNATEPIRDTRPTRGRSSACRRAIFAEKRLRQKRSLSGACRPQRMRCGGRHPIESAKTRPSNQRIVVGCRP